MPSSGIDRDVVDEPRFPKKSRCEHSASRRAGIWQLQRDFVSDLDVIGFESIFAQPLFGRGFQLVVAVVSAQDSVPEFAKRFIKPWRDFSFVSAQVLVAAGQRESIGRALRCHTHNLEREVQLSNHVSDHGELLPVLLAKVGEVSAC